MPNRRKRSRIRGSYECSLEVMGKLWPCTTLDISMKGARIDVSPLPPLREECVLHIPLTDEVQLTLEGAIVRVGTDEAAMDFSGMDEETYAHLLNMVRLRAENADMVEREAVEEPFEG